MSNTNGANEKNDKGRSRAQEMIHLIEIGDWDALDRLQGVTPEEIERILREEPMVDAAEVNRLLEICDEEFAEVLKSPPVELRSLPRKGQQ